MQRFFIDIELGPKISLEDKDFFHQISHVLRSRLGDEVCLFNGNGFDSIYKIIGISKKSIELSFISKSVNEADPKIKLSLYQSMPNKFEKIDFILQKGVEIGISAFIFYKSERSGNLVISDNKIVRFKNIIKEALEQCGGNKMPELIFTDKLDLSDIKGDKLVCHTDGKIKSEIKFKNKADISIFVGPEGGYSEKEIDAFKKLDYTFINFGERILRTETVGSALAFHIINSN